MRERDDLEAMGDAPARVRTAFATLRLDDAARRETAIAGALRDARFDVEAPAGGRSSVFGRLALAAASIAVVAAVGGTSFLIATQDSSGTGAELGLAAKAAGPSSNGVPSVAPGDTWLERTLATAPDGATIRLESDVASGPIRVNKPITLVAGDRGVRIGGV